MGIAERKAREFQRRERDILDAALTLFDHDDWQAVTVERIAREAEIGKGTVYKHFDSKEEIYARLALEFHQGVLQRLQQVDAAQDVISRLRTMIHLFWDCHMESREYYRVVSYCNRDDFKASLRQATQQAFEHLDEAYAEIIHPVIAQGIEEGLFPRKPIPLLLFGAAAAMNGAITMAWSGCRIAPDPKQHVEELANFILAGLTYQDRRF